MDVTDLIKYVPKLITSFLAILGGSFGAILSFVQALIHVARSIADIVTFVSGLGAGFEEFIH